MRCRASGALIDPPPSPSASLNSCRMIASRLMEIGVSPMFVVSLVDGSVSRRPISRTTLDEAVLTLSASLTWIWNLIWFLPSVSLSSLPHFAPIALTDLSITPTATVSSSKQGLESRCTTPGVKSEFFFSSSSLSWFPSLCNISIPTFYLDSLSKGNDCNQCVLTRANCFALLSMLSRIENSRAHFSASRLSEY